MPIDKVFFLICCLCLIYTSAEQYFEEDVEATKVSIGQSIGDPCEERCSEELIHSFCNKASNTCECDDAHPVVLNKFICLSPLSLGEVCNHGESCSYYEPNAICAKISKYYYKCACKDDYQQITTAGKNKCIPVNGQEFIVTSTSMLPSLKKNSVKRENNAQTDVPTVLGVGVGMGLFAALTCLVLRLFSNARFGEPRGHYANANLSPPISLTNTPAMTPGSRRSSGQESNPSSRRPSYTMLAPPIKSGPRRPSTGSIQSQSSARSFGGQRFHDTLRPTVSAPTPEVGSPRLPISRSPIRKELRIPIFSNVVVEENDTIEASPELHIKV